MAERVRKQRPERKQEQAPAEAEQKAATSSHEETLDDLDALLADIDEALGENLEHAQEFVSNFLQKGGE
jgi:ubiquitin-like protein Pup